MENKLPAGWYSCLLSEVLFFQEGPGLRTFQMGESGIPFLNIRTFNDDETLDKSKCKFVKTEEFKNKYEHFLLNEGDIVVSSSGTLGKVIVIRSDDLPVMLNTSVIRFRSIYKDVLKQSFLKYFLKSDLFFRQIQEQKTGMAIDNYGPSHLNKMRFVMPPIHEQQRIVSKLDILFENIERIRKRLLRIEQIEYEIFLKNIFDGQDLYETIRLGNFCQEQTQVIGNHWKNVRLIGVSKEFGVVDLRVGGKNSFERYKIVKPGWFLYNPMRVDIGSIAIWDGDELAITSPDYVVFSVKQDISPCLLLRFLKSNYGLSEINNNTQGAVRSRLYYRNLAKIKFPFSGKQNHREAEQILNGFNIYNQKKDSLEKLLDKLKQSILSKAFRGELVPQDPNDEPAHVLLERINAEQGILKVAKRGKKTKSTISNE